MTNAEIAILTVLAEKPCHGYEIEAIIEARGMREWTEVGFSSIYYVLKKLEAKGLVEGAAVSEGSRGPARITYRMTGAGAAALRDAAVEALSVPQPGYSPFLLGLANLPCLAPAELGKALSQYRAALTAKSDELRHRREQEQPGAPAFVTAMFDRSLALIRAELQWLSEFETRYIHEEVPEMTQLYKAKADPEIVEIPDTGCLTTTGVGAPESPEFQQAVEALYGLAYSLKFQLKPSGINFSVPALEGLWWVEGETEWFATPRDRWHWQLLIRMPEAVTEELVAQARPAVAAKKQNPAIHQVRYERFAEGAVAQLLHVGPFAAERPNIERLHAFIDQQGYRARGRHHEVYLSDFRRTAPEKLKTILRQPVEPVAP